MQSGLEPGSPPPPPHAATKSVSRVTPLSFSLPPGKDRSASAELTFALEGYQSMTVMAQGTGPEVVVKQTLPKLKKTPVKKNNNNPPGYKDDPYQ